MESHSAPLPIEVSPAPTNTPEKLKSSTSRRLVNWLKEFGTEELSPVIWSLMSVWFWVALLVSAFILVLAFQFGFSKVFELTSSQERPYLVDYYAPEYFDGTAYRWTKPSSNIRLANVGQMPGVKAKLTLYGRPEGLPAPTINIAINSKPVTTVVPNQLNNIYQLEYNSENRALVSAEDDQINIWLRMDALLSKGDSRPLGIAVGGIEIEGQGLFQTGRPVIPSWGVVGLLIGSLAIVFILGIRAGWKPRLTAAGIIFLALLLAVGLVQDRPTTVLAAPLIIEAVLFTYPLTIIGLRFTRWVLKRNKLGFTENSSRFLALIFMLAFVIRLVGINHDSFQVLDHGFRIHEVAAIKDNPSVIFSRYYSMNTYDGVGGVQGRSVVAGQWGLKVTLPYTPLFYIADLPIAYFTVPDDPRLLHGTNILAVLIDVSALFFLYLIARHTLGRYGQVAGLVGAFLSCFFPLSFLMDSDGGYNTMLATWLVLAWLAVFTGWLAPARYNPAGKISLPGWGAVFWMGVLLALAFLGHASTLLIVGTMLAIYLGLIFFWQGGRQRYLAGRLGAMYGIGLALSFVSYYMFYAWALVTSTIPTILSEMGKGKKIGDSKSAVIQFWPSLWAHFHFLPVLVTAGLIGGLVALNLFGGRKSLKIENNYLKRLKEEINTPSVLLYFSWLVTFLLFSFVSTKINLLQKHMLFGLPLFGLITGLALAIIVDYLRYRVEEAARLKPVRPWPKATIWLGRLAIAAVVVWFLAAGSYTWYIRAIHYILPAGTG